MKMNIWPGYEYKNNLKKFKQKIKVVNENDDSLIYNFTTKTKITIVGINNLK